MAIDPLLQRLGELSWPALVLDQPEPVAGQVWRAEWGGVACLVVVSGARAGRTVPVMAATTDDVGDDGAIIGATENGMTLTVWAAVSGSIKTLALEHRITDLTRRSLDTLLAVAARRRRGDWAPITNALDDRVLIRADLAERLHSLSEAEWLPEATRDAPTLTEVAAKNDLRPSQLAVELDTTPGDARRLLQGKREPTVEEVAILAEILGSTPNVAVQFDKDLVAELDQPEFRPALRLIASSEHDGDEVAARRACAGQVIALAARHREHGERNWAALLREELRVD